VITAPAIRAEVLKATAEGQTELAKVVARQPDRVDSALLQEAFDLIRLGLPETRRMSQHSDRRDENSCA